MKPKLLVVDDEVEIQEMLRRHFEYIGFNVKTVSNGAEALDVLEQIKIDVVISDIKMPVMDGIDLLRAIRNQFPMVHVIMITAYVSLDNALSCMRLGADTCVFKPLEDLGELEQAVEQALRAIKHWQKKLKELQTMKT